MYFNVVVLVIVNGQPTTDDDIDKHEIAQLREELAKVRGELARSVSRIGKVEGQLSASADKIVELEGQLAAMSASKQNASKFQYVSFMFTKFDMMLNARYKVSGTRL